MTNVVLAEAASRQAPLWTSFVPLVVMTIPLIVLVAWIAPRKGQSRLFALLAILPCIGIFVLIYLVSLTDKQVLDDIRSLKERDAGQSDLNR